MIERKARTPVSRSIAMSAMASRPSCEKWRVFPLRWKSALYCWVRELRGSLRTRTRASLSSVSKFAMTGSRPMNSGMSPNSTRSLGIRKGA